MSGHDEEMFPELSPEDLLREERARREAMNRPAPAFVTERPAAPPPKRTRAPRVDQAKAMPAEVVHPASQERPDSAVAVDDAEPKRTRAGGRTMTPANAAAWDELQRLGRCTVATRAGVEGMRHAAARAGRRIASRWGADGTCVVALVPADGGAPPRRAARPQAGRRGAGEPGRG